MADVVKTSTADNKRRIYMSSNEVTLSFVENTRVLTSDGSAYRITHVNTSEENSAGMDSNGVVDCLLLRDIVQDNDDLVNLVAYNESYEIKETEPNKINGKDKIIISSTATYEYPSDEDLIWDIDSNLVSVSIVDDKCILKAVNNINNVGKQICLTVKNIDGTELDKKIITIVGLI